MNKELFKYKTIDSTNNEALRLLRSGRISSQCYIVSDYQQQGRGQKENSWFAKSRDAMLLTAVLYPEFLSVSSQFVLSKAVSVSVLSLLEEYQIHASIKWPNDILVASNKIGGILIEISIMGNSIKYALGGVGLNVNNRSFPNFDRPATSMKLVTNKNFDIDQLTRKFIQYLEREFERISNGKFDHLNEVYLEKLYMFEEKAVFEDENGVFEGTIKGLSPDGELLIDKHGKTIQYPFHAIKMRS
ncbi:MAG TPA: biotin--[acetyl-CoA-carboxylase] ligase [Bacteroidales bacterium]|nr:biotin--[acetyl-CoA-carboxylase] ligase [Bacteroidales bacterium]